MILQIHHMLMFELSSIAQGKHKFTVEKNLIYEFGSVTGVIQ